jgi:hypothetical protein
VHLWCSLTSRIQLLQCVVERQDSVTDDPQEYVNVPRSQTERLDAYPCILLFAGVVGVVGAGNSDTLLS